MRKIVAAPFIALYGVYEAPETWHVPYVNDEMGEAMTSRMAGSDCMLLRAGLRDESRLLIHPIVVGHGKRLVDDGEPVPLTLVEARTFSTGVLALA